MVVLLYNGNTHTNNIHTVKEVSVRNNGHSHLLYLILQNDNWVSLDFPSEDDANRCLLELYEKGKLDWRFKSIGSFANIYQRKPSMSVSDMTTIIQ